MDFRGIGGTDLSKARVRVGSESLPCGGGGAVYVVDAVASLVRG